MDRAEARNVSARKHRAKKRAMMRAIKEATGCMDCGYNEHFAALEFDHVRGTKEFEIGRLAHGRSMDRLLAEVAKCEVVCANCHAVRTYKRRSEC